MNESLYSNSPYLLILSFAALALSIYFPVMMGSKMTVSQIPAHLRGLTIANLAWNALSLVGMFFFSGKIEYGTFAYTIRQILFGVQACAWIYIGFVVNQIADSILFQNHKSIHKYSIVAGILIIAILTLILVKDPALIARISVFGFEPFKEHVIFGSFTVLYMVSLLPAFILAIYQMLKGTYRALDPSIVQTGSYMAGTLAFFVTMAFAFDFVIPIVSTHSSINGQFHFLIWHQLLCILLAILCGQYFTSIRFRDHSALWLLRKLVSKMEDGIIYFDNNGKIFYFNQGAVKLLNLPGDSLQGKSIKSVFPPSLDFFNEFVYNNIRLDVSGEPHTFKIHFSKVRQSLITFFNVAYFTDQSKTLLLQQNLKTLNEQYVEYTHDLVRYQNRLDREASIKAEKENALNTLINALPFRVWYKNELGVYQKQNQQDLNSQGSLEGITDIPEKITSYEKNARENGEVGVYTSFVNKDGEEVSQDEANRLAKDGEPVQTYDNMYIPILQGKAPFRTMCIKIDITEQRRMEQERNMLREQKFIHSRLEELGTMCGAFAHDYNNILGSQIGFCQLAQEMLPQDHQANMFISEALKAAQRGKTSLEELLNAIRGNAKSATPAMVFSPYMIIEDVVKKISLTLPPNISIHSEDLDHSLKIRGIVASLDRIISNMANNALFAMKATGGGTLTFTLHEVTLESQLVTPYAPPIPPGNYAKIDIADTGTGMDSGTLERIFAPFFTTKAPGEGLGLGLSSALRLLKEGNAYFTVHTTLGEGTIFNLYWPLETDTKED